MIASCPRCHAKADIFVGRYELICVSCMQSRRGSVVSSSPTERAIPLPRHLYRSRR